MEAGNVRVSTISKSMLALIEAVGVPTLPRKEDLTKEGWFTAAEYAKATGRGETSARRLLRNNKRLDTQAALVRYGVVKMFRPKTSTKK